MKTYDVVQGSAEWWALRIGIPTASQFDRILTPAKLEYAKGAESYRNELLAEWLLGQPLDTTATDWMDRGTEMEAEAIRFYEFSRDVDVTRTGFTTTDDGKAGCSPDGLVGEAGGLEIKNRAAHTHVGLLLGGDPIPKGQVQGGIWICERDWWDVLCYNPMMPPVLVRTYRDDKHIKALVDALARFNDELDAAKDTLTRLGKAGRISL